MKNVVIGANGQLGVDVCAVFAEQGHEVFEVNHDTIDIADRENCHRIIEKTRPDIVINTAAMHNVEQCENDPALSFSVNGVGARNLAELSNEMGFILIHISTDYVFNGEKRIPYLENDCPMPINVYGNTKLAGEHFIRSIAERYFIVRVSALYGHNPCRAKSGKNFIQLMLSLAKERGKVSVIDNEYISPTFTKDVAKQLVLLSNSNSFGLYHSTAQGYCSWFEFAEKIFSLTGVAVALEKAAPGQFPMKVPRPSWSVLENKALQDQRLDIMPHWMDGLKRYFEDA